MAKRKRSRRQAQGIDFKAFGIDVVNRRIKKLDAKMQKKIVNKALRQAAKDRLKPTVDAGIASVSPGMEGTGRLREKGSTVRKMKMKRSRSRHVFGFEVATPTREKLDIQGDGAYYPALLEYGQPKRGIPGKWYLRRAMRESKEAVKTRFTVLLRSALNSTVRALKGVG